MEGSAIHQDPMTSEWTPLFVWLFLYKVSNCKEAGTHLFSATYWVSVPRQGTSHQYQWWIMIFGTCHLILSLFVGSTNYFQIVRQQCCRSVPVLFAYGQHLVGVQCARGDIIPLRHGGAWSGHLLLILISGLPSFIEYEYEYIYFRIVFIMLSTFFIILQKTIQGQS